MATLARPAHEFESLDTVTACVITGETVTEPLCYAGRDDDVQCRALLMMLRDFLI